MNICMISYSQYDYDNRVHREAESLVQRGVNVDVIALRVNGKPKFRILNGVGIYGIQRRRFNERGPFSYLIKLLLFFVLSTFTVNRLYLKRRYKIIHFHNIPDIGIFCTIFPKIMGARIILDVHDPVPEFYALKFGLDEKHVLVRLLKWMEKVSTAYADHVITVHTLLRDTLIGRSVPESKCTVVLNAPDPKLFRRSKWISRHQARPFTLIYPGALNEFTGVEIAVRALDIARKSIPRIRFEIFGQGREQANLEQLVRDLELERVVHFNKPAPISAVPGLLAQADVGIDPKHAGLLSGEGLSSKTLEFLAVGLPAVVSRTKASQTYFDDSMVMFFQPGNEQDLARCILQLYQNPDKIRELAVNAERFGRTHGWEQYEKVYYEVIDRLVQGRCR